MFWKSLEVAEPVIVLCRGNLLILNRNFNAEYIFQLKRGKELLILRCSVEAEKSIPGTPKSETVEVYMGSGCWWFPVVDQTLWTSHAPLNHTHQGVFPTLGCHHWQSAFGPKAKGGKDLFLWPQPRERTNWAFFYSADVVKQKEMKRGRCSCLSEK